MGVLYGRNIKGSGEIAHLFWGATLRRAAYDPETVAMLTSVLERAVAQFRASSAPMNVRRVWHQAYLRRPARGERDPIQLYAIALGVGPWEPTIGGAPPASPPLSRRA